MKTADPGLLLIRKVLFFYNRGGMKLLASKTASFIGIRFRSLLAGLLRPFGWNTIPTAMAVLGRAAGNKLTSEVLEELLAILDCPSFSRQRVVVPDYLQSLLERVGGLIGDGKIVFIPYHRAIQEKPDFVLVHLGMVEQIEPILSMHKESYAPVFGNDGFLIITSHAGDKPNARATASWETIWRTLAKIGEVRKNNGIIEGPGGTIFRIHSTAMDVGIISEVERDYMSWLRPKLLSSDTVIDVGAHVGTFTVLVAKAVSSGRVFAYEPAPDNFSLLLENLSLNGLTNVQPHNVAVSAKAGRATLYLSSDNSGGHQLHIGPRITKGQVDVDVTTLTEIIANLESPVAALKVDAEGSEVEILVPNANLLAERVRRLIIEAHGTCGIILPFLHDSGFRTDHVGDDGLMVIRAWRASN